MSREWALYFADIVEACEKIARFTHKVSQAQFETEDMVRDAVLRNLMVIGEAAKRIPDEQKLEYGHVEWRKIAGFRDVIAHAYFGINAEILWDIVHAKVPELLASIKAQNSAS